VEVEQLGALVVEQLVEKVKNGDISFSMCGAVSVESDVGAESSSGKLGWHLRAGMVSHENTLVAPQPPRPISIAKSSCFWKLAVTASCLHSLPPTRPTRPTLKAHWLSHQVPLYTKHVFSIQQVRQHSSTVIQAISLELVDLIGPWSTWCNQALTLSPEPEETVYPEIWNDRTVLAHRIARLSGCWKFLNCGRVVVQGLAVWRPFVLWSRLAASFAATIFFVRDGT
jgi:hypothetical protein